MDEPEESDPRRLAYKRIKARRDFYQHLAIYLLVNIALVLVWATTGQGYFWPAWVLGGWGIGVIANAWAVFARPITEEDVNRELERMHHA